jgi:Uma2 family endonuclease
MATASGSKRRSAFEGLRPYKLNVRQYMKMIDAGIFPEGARVELIAGLLSTKNINVNTTWFEDVSIYRLSVSQFEKMITARIFPPSARVELLGGIPATQMTKHTPHNFAVGRLGNALREIVLPEYVVREEKSAPLTRVWRPEPDIVVAHGPDDRYRKADPSAAEVALIVEVAESSYSTDRGVKWHGYAAAAVPVYWIVNLEKRVVEVYTAPTGRGKNARYANKATFNAGDTVPVVITDREIGGVAVNEILP